MKRSSLPLICLMGPTTCGKTALSIELARLFPVEIISVDSAMIYRGMNIGTAKPTSDILATIPHHLIDRMDPKESYSAGQFRIDALDAIQTILDKKKIPLFVGGTMLYFRVLQFGLAELPKADAALRLELQERGAQIGWDQLHRELSVIDPKAASRIETKDRHRIQRALEVYLLTGKNISTWQEEYSSSKEYSFISLGLMPYDRAKLHERIAERFYSMLSQGFVEEARALYERGDLSLTLPSMRSVGYAQVFRYLAGQITYDEMCNQAIAATRQLAKRQMTWLRTWPEIKLINADHLALEQVINLCYAALSAA